MSQSKRKGPRAWRGWERGRAGTLGQGFVRRTPTPPPPPAPGPHHMEDHCFSVASDNISRSANGRYLILLTVELSCE